MINYHLLKEKKLEKKKTVLNEKKDYFKVIVIIALIILITLLGIYIMRRFIFNKQINSKVIENYRKLKSNKRKDKLSELTEDSQEGENI